MFTLTGVNVAILSIGQSQVLMGVEMELFLNKDVELVMRSNRQTNVSHLPCDELSLRARGSIMGLVLAGDRLQASHTSLSFFYPQKTFKNTV